VVSGIASVFVINIKFTSPNTKDSLSRKAMRMSFSISLINELLEYSSRSRGKNNFSGLYIWKKNKKRKGKIMRYTRSSHDIVTSTEGLSNNNSRKRKKKYALIFLF